MTTVPEFPEGMVPLGNERFPFRCHPGVSCFTICCQKVDLLLYPYDVLRLKNSLGLDSETFLSQYANLVNGDNPYFPSVMLRLTDTGKGNCPFLSVNGCSIYEDRPTGCRTYPLERAVARSPEHQRRTDHYFLVKHDYCRGHDEEEMVTAKEYIRSQKLAQHNLYNELWTELDTLFRTNPWEGEGTGGPRQQLAFMVCYNIYGFRRMANERNLFDQFRLNRDTRRAMTNQDEALLKFGFEWLKLVLTGRSSLLRR